MTFSALPALDNPVWSALATAQSRFRLGNMLACRYLPDVAPFAAVATDTTQARHALCLLLESGEQAALLSPAPIADHEAMRAQQVGVIHQMVAAPLAGAAADPDMIPLGTADCAEMLALVQQTRPGPFCKRTPEMGHYIGIREGGRLIAMAGERMRLDDYVEISAVCVDQGWRGRGLASRLIRQLQGDIEQRGQTPFLHVLSNNHNAIALYERLGFTLRRTFYLTLISRAEARAA